jgi:glycine cleavage system aminomethyltransferase T
MSYAFLSVAPDVVARSPMERAARAAGARFEVRDGWNVAVEYPPLQDAPVTWADASHLAKLELHGPHKLKLGTAKRERKGWVCPLTKDRALVIGDPRGREGVDVTSGWAAMRIQGPLARELFARFCALDLRPHVTPPGAFRPGSVARTPGMVLHEGEDTYLALVGAALGDYLWTVVEDAGRHLGGGPIPYA